MELVGGGAYPVKFFIQPKLETISVLSNNIEYLLEKVVHFLHFEAKTVSKSFVEAARVQTHSVEFSPKYLPNPV